MDIGVFMKILIQAYHEGYMLTDYITGKKYAKETPEGVIAAITKLLIGDSQEISKLIPEVSQPESNNDGHSEITQKIELPVVNVPKETLFIPHFDYDLSQRKEIKGYTNIGVVETPDGKAMIDYKKVHYYTTKEKILKIPYPIPRGYFKDMKISSVALTCVRAYRDYLEFEEKPNENGTCDDVTYEECIGKDKDQCKFCTKESRFEKAEKSKPIKEMVIKMGE